MKDTVFTITLNDVYFLLILLAALWGAVKIYREWKKPSEELKDMVDRHSEWLKRDNERIRKVEECQKLELRCLYSIIDNQITGNGKEEFKKLKQEINDFLLERKSNHDN